MTTGSHAADDKSMAKRSMCYSVVVTVYLRLQAEDDITMAKRSTCNSAMVTAYL